MEKEHDIQDLFGIPDNVCGVNVFAVEDGCRPLPPAVFSERHGVHDRPTQRLLILPQKLGFNASGVLGVAGE